MADRGIAERTPNLVSATRTGTADAVAFVPTGTWVAVTAATFKSDTAASLMVIEEGDGTNQWVIELAGAGVVHCDFPHPLLLNGLGVVL